MTLQISQPGEEYLKTAQTMLCAAQTMIDRAIAGQLKALADVYQRRVEKCGQSIGPRTSLQRDGVMKAI